MLVLSLLTVAVAAAVAGTSMVMNAASASDGEFGRASSLSRVDASHPEAARAQLATARQRFGTVEVISHRSVSVPGSAEPIDLRGQDPGAPLGGPLLHLRSGRFPAGSDEVALTPATARLLSARIGDQVELGGASRTLVGIVENPSDLGDDFALVAPDESAPADSLTLLFDAPGRAGTSSQVDGGSGSGAALVVIGRGDPGPVGPLVLVATALAMALVGLIAAAGFVVVAQRRQHQLGLLAAIGATERHLRLVMVATGAIVGATAAVLGAALGVLGWIVAAPTIETAAGHRIGRLDLPWSLIAATMVLAVVTATAAAWWPARTVARQPVMGALSGRPARPLPVHRSSALALLLVVVGVVAIASVHPISTRGDSVQPLLLLGGIAAVVLGVVFAAPAAIRAIALPAARLPFAARLALRDLARYQARAAAALAAITLTLGLSVAVVGIAKANEYRSDTGNLSSHQLLIRAGASDAPTIAVPNADEDASLDAHARSVADTVDGSTLVPLDVAVGPPTSSDPSHREAVGEVVVDSTSSVRLVTVPVVATPEVLQYLGIDPSTIDDTTDLITSSSEDVQLFVPARDRKQPSDTAVQRVDLPAYSSAPTALITEQALTRHGWSRTPAGWLVDSPQPLTTAQIASARASAAQQGLTIETRSGQDDLSTTRTVATTVGVLLALATLAMTVGLIRNEGAGDLRTLTATGAGTRTRRALTATTAGALTLLGAGLGIAGAYLALAAAYHADLGQLLPMPVADLLVLAVGLPIVATAAGWLFAGREPRTFSRQALD